MDGERKRGKGGKRDTRKARNPRGREDGALFVSTCNHVYLSLHSLLFSIISSAPFLSFASQILGTHFRAQLNSFLSGSGSKLVLYSFLIHNEGLCSWKPKGRKNEMRREREKREKPSQLINPISLIFLIHSFLSSCTPPWCASTSVILPCLGAPPGKAALGAIGRRRTLTMEVTYLPSLLIHSPQLALHFFPPSSENFLARRSKKNAFLLLLTSTTIILNHDPTDIIQQFFSLLLLPQKNSCRETDPFFLTFFPQQQHDHHFCLRIRGTGWNHFIINTFAANHSQAAKKWLWLISLLSFRILWLFFFKTCLFWNQF